MSLDVYFRDDLARMLRSVCVVASATITSPAEARGFALAVRAMAEAIGVNPVREQVLGAELARQLDAPAPAEPRRHT